MGAPKIPGPQGPTQAEITQGELAGREQQRFMTRTVPIAKDLSSRIDNMTSDYQVGRQQGQFASATQQGFDGVGLLRAQALMHQGGSGAGTAGVESGFRGLSKALSQGGSNIYTQAKQTQEKARTGFAKMGQGMSDGITAGLGQLGQTQASNAQSQLEYDKAMAKQKLDLYQTGASVANNLMGRATGGIASELSAAKANGREFSWGNAGLAAMGGTIGKKE